jgi:adenosine kinase
MRIAVTGSIATDHLMVFPGRFSEQLLVDQLDNVSLSFLVEQLDVRRGGVAANIAYGLGLLGLCPVLVGAVGQDFDDYGVWLRTNGVDTDWVRVSQTRHTARFLCTTDDYQNQIASFYAGAMTEAREIELAGIADRLNGLDLVHVGPNDPTAMLRHSEECRTRRYRFAADPSQQLARMSRGEVLSLVDGAELLFTNEYESELLLDRTGLAPAGMLDRVGTWVITRGELGVRIVSAGRPPLVVPAVPAKAIADPTGAGDAFRAGFLAGLSWDLGLERAAHIGCALATLAIECRGPQDYTVDPAALADTLSTTYGPASAAEVGPALGGVHRPAEDHCVRGYD